jgi:hypothetical protein
MYGVHVVGGSNPLAPTNKSLEKSENLTTHLFKLINQKMLGAPPGHQIAQFGFSPHSSVV